jgi:hypothetical protein
VQPADVGYHADFEREFEREMIPAKKAALALKAAELKASNKLTTHVTLTAGEWRELMVEVGGRVWYELISEETIAKSHLSAGISNSLSGNQNELVKAQLPSGRRVFPSYGGEATLSRPAQAGFGVSVSGQVCEVVGDQASHHSAAVVSTPTPKPELVVQRTADDMQLVFRTEEEQKQYEAKTKLKTKKQKVTETDVEEGSEHKDSDAESTETSDEEHHAFDQEHFFAEAKARTGRDFTLDLSPPEVLDSSLVGRFIAFHHGDPDPGWDCGEVKCEVDPATHKEGFTFDVFYPSRGGTIFHRLQLELYGVGDEEGSPLGSWVLLSTGTKKKRRRNNKTNV